MATRQSSSSQRRPPLDNGRVTECTTNLNTNIFSGHKLNIMVVFSARKHASLSFLHCCLCFCRCMVLHLSCPHAENVTCHIGDIPPRDSRRKQKFIFLPRKITKIIVTHSDLNKWILYDLWFGNINVLDYLLPVLVKLLGNGNYWLITDYFSRK